MTKSKILGGAAVALAGVAGAFAMPAAAADNNVDHNSAIQIHWTQSDTAPTACLNGVVVSIFGTRILTVPPLCLG